jgi:hypothetical protein
MVIASRCKVKPTADEDRYASQAADKVPAEDAFGSDGQGGEEVKD